MELIRNFKKLYKYTKGCRKYLVLYLIFSLLIMAIGVLLPIITSYQLVNLTSGVWNKVIAYTFLWFFLSLFDSLISRLNSYVSQKFQMKVSSLVQISLCSEILKIKLEDIDKHSNGLFIQRLTSDTNEASSIFSSGITDISWFIRSISIFIVVFAINKIIGLYFIGYFIINFLYDKYRFKKINDKDKEYRTSRENTSGFATELIRGIRDIKMLNVESLIIKKAQDKIYEVNEKGFDISTQRRILSFVSSFIEDLFFLCLGIILVCFVKNGAISIAMAIVVYNYRYEAISLGFTIDRVFDFSQKFNLTCDRLFEILDGKEDYRKEVFGNKIIKKVKGEFEFDNVSFGYNDKKQVLKDISFKINPNETVAFVGKSGVGKTTIFNLLLKFYDVDSGSIKIDGIDVQELDKDSIRGNITVISQEPYIFNMSIRDNFLLFKKNLTEKEMIKYCKMASIHDYINSLPDKYDTMLGENGINLSGGQKQRIAIARAFMQNTKIILFDEATSALDNETQADIQKAIDNMKNKYTIMIIAHRLSTIINCDKIVFLDDGKIAAIDTHKNLMKKNKSYKELYESEIIK